MRLWSSSSAVTVLLNPFHSGVYAPPMDKLTAQGYDLQIGTNVLGKVVSHLHCMRS
jgi:hypothetical protein